MKATKTIMGLAIAALTMTACSSNSFKVKGVAEGFADGDTILVMSDSPVPLDTIIVKDGRFEWGGEVDSVFVCTRQCFTQSEKALFEYLFWLSQLKSVILQQKR